MKEIVYKVRDQQILKHKILELFQKVVLNSVGTGQRSLTKCEIGGGVKKSLKFALRN